ncbi:MAG TPA: CpsD/CapB family tyrosine-protein kinase [Terriglobales bacterium]|jgi:capsular exopolysaccharide synthesis family protein|nr:CpsD/CapB family tyrosine-protein kinase [Terriglobales bacterium]
MSKIFEALQRSEEDRFGTSFPESSLATDLLRRAEQNSAGPVSPQITLPEIGLPEIAPAEFTDSGNIPVTVFPGSRLVCLSDTESLAAEKFRFLSVRLRQIQQSRPLKKILITSTIPEEGKSMVSSNLAAVLARRKQQRTLLLEGDLRRPVLGSRFGLGKLAGLTEWLQGEPKPMTSIYHLEGAGFWFLPAGHPAENPLELMQSGRLSSLIEQLTASFDWIIIDSPPVLPLADTSLWVRLVDGVLLVAREGVTRKRQLKRGLEALDQSKLLGMVLNSSTNSDHENYYQRYSPVATTQQSGSSQDSPSSLNQ